MRLLWSVEHGACYVQNIAFMAPLNFPIIVQTLWSVHATHGAFELLTLSGTFSH